MTAAPRIRPPIDGPWLITFADLAAVMLAFFVMLFAMQDIEAEKWQAALDGLNRHIDQAPLEDPAAAASVTVDLGEAERGLDLDYLAAILDERLAAAPELEAVIERRPAALTLALPLGALFDGARPSAQGAALAEQLGQVVGGLRNRIDIVVRLPGSAGTGAPPIADWQRALVRAAAVAEAMRRGGAMVPVAVIGRRGPAGGAGRVEIVVRDGRGVG